MCGGCGECARCERAAYMRAWWRSKSLDERRAKIARRDPERVRTYEQRRYQERRDSLFVEVNRITSNAIKRGRLVRQPCEVCGAERVEAHHDDYSRPYDVRWLCKRHHDEHHMQEAA